MQPSGLPDEQRMEYNQLLEQVYRMTRDIENKLPMYYIVLRSDGMIRKLVAIVSVPLCCLCHVKRFSFRS
jgi:hypothetical protein